MLESQSSLATRRRAVRRAAQFECAVHSALWDGPAFYRATDVSPFGVWLSADLALEVGERVELAFRPPRWPSWAWPIMATGEVARVELPRRRGDVQRPGMAVRFTEIDPEVFAELSCRLRGLPPPLPCRSVVETAPELIIDVEIVADPGDELDLDIEIDIDLDLPQALVLADGHCLEFRAEAELLTAGRPRAALEAHDRVRRRRARAEHQGRARSVRRAARRTCTEQAAARKPLLRLVG
jgi:hypothetical protein